MQPESGMDNKDEATQNIGVPSDSTPTAVPPPINPTPASQPTPAQELANTEADIEERMSSFERSTIRWTRAMFVVTAATMVFIAFQWHEMHDAGTQTDRIIAADERLARAMEDSVTQAKTGLDASITASRTDQRAWMDMIIDPPPNFREDASFTTFAQMKNLGKTPAKKIGFGYLYEGIMPSTHPVFDDLRLKFVNFGMLPPQGPAVLPVEITPGKPDELLGKGRFEAIRDGKSRCLLLGHD